MQTSPQKVVLLQECLCLVLHGLRPLADSISQPNTPRYPRPEDEVCDDLGPSNTIPQSAGSHRRNRARAKISRTYILPRTNKNKNTGLLPGRPTGSEDASDVDVRAGDEAGVCETHRDKEREGGRERRKSSGERETTAQLEHSEWGLCDLPNSPGPPHPHKIRGKGCGEKCCLTGRARSRKTRSRRVRREKVERCKAKAGVGEGGL